MRFHQVRLHVVFTDQTDLGAEPLIGNITRRILFLLREEARAASQMATSNQAVTSPPQAARAQPHPSVAQSLAALSLSPSAPSSPASSFTAAAAEDRTGMGPLPPRSFSISDLVNSGMFSEVSSPAIGSPSTPEVSSAETPGTPTGIGGEDAGSRGRRDVQPGTSHAYQLKPLLIQAIQELIDELETVDTNVAKDAKDHIHSGEVILTLGESSTVRSFLRSAAKYRKFITVVPESAPSFAGHAMARSLSQAGLSVLLVPDSNLYALMPRISKVLLGVRCVLANGGILATTDAKAVAMAARDHSTPVVALTGVYKISPDWGWVRPERLTGENQGAVAQVVNFAQARRLAEDAEILNPLWDYVPPNYLDVIITNVGEHPPSYVYRLIQENYHEEDYCL